MIRIKLNSDMAKDPAFLFYPGDFNTGTQFFNDTQVGQYMRLLMAQHQHGHLNDNQVIFICKSYDNDVMSKFKKDSNGLWYNERLEIEVNKRKNYVESRSKNKEGKTKEKIISKSYDEHMENKDRDINELHLINKEPEIELWPNFENFWDKYDKKEDRAKCESKWRKVKQAEREKIMQHLDDYITSTPDKTYRKNPSTYLNNESWNNEIVINRQYTNGNKNGLTAQGTLDRLNSYTD